MRPYQGDYVARTRDERLVYRARTLVPFLSNIGAYGVRESHTKSVRARLRRCSLAFRSCYYASARAPRCMKRLSDLSSSPFFTPPGSLLLFLFSSSLFRPIDAFFLLFSERERERERKEETAKVWHKHIHEQQGERGRRGERDRTGVVDSLSIQHKVQ